MNRTLFILSFVTLFVASVCCGGNHVHADVVTAAGVGIATSRLDDGVNKIIDDNNLELFVLTDVGLGRLFYAQGRVAYTNLDSDDTVNATVAIKLKYPARFTPYALVGGGWQNTGFVTEGVKSIVTVAFGISGDAGPVGLFVELRGIAFNEDLTGQGVDAINESVNVGFRVKSF